MSYDKTTVPENEQTTTKDDFIHVIDYLQKEKKIKQTTFPANTHSPAPTAIQLLARPTAGARAGAPPATPKPLNRSSPKFTYVIMSWISTIVQNLIQIGSLSDLD